jgi:hypothetical protein
MAPAVGILMSELICDGRTSTMDIAPFRLARFAEEQPLYGEHPYSTSWHTGHREKELLTRNVEGSEHPSASALAKDADAPSSLV